MSQNSYSPNLQLFGIPQNDPGFIYAVRTGNYVKVGKTIDPKRRLLREAKTWCPNKIDEIIARPFWNIGKLEYSLHVGLAEHWHRGEWHLFKEEYWLNFLLDGLRQFSKSDFDRNSIDFAYWIQGTNFIEVIDEQCAHGMSLPKWRACHGDPWAHDRERIRAELKKGN